MDIVREFCDRAILIEDSRIVASGNADEVAEQYMRLFNPSPDEQPETHPDQPPESRWGEGQVRFDTVRVPAVCSEPDDLVIELEAVATHEVREAVYGFLVSTSSGTAILGTNSRLKKYRCGALTKGERVHMCWTVPNLFADGRHSIDLAISDGPGLVIYDYWKEAAWFTVVKAEKTPFIITPDSRFTFGKGTLASDASGET